MSRHLCWQRVRQEARDALELVLLPGLAAVLPWRWCFKVFKILAGSAWLYREPAERAADQAMQCGWLEAPQRQAWLRQRKLVTLVDHADLYLGLSRSDAWMQRHLLVQGQWPEPGRAALLCTFHWGAGMWGLRHAAQAGLRAHALVAPLDGAGFVGRAVLQRYARWRTQAVAQTLGCATLDVSRSLRPVLQALKQHEQVLAAIDVPSDQVSSSHEIAFLGGRARVPDGLLRLAHERQVPITWYLTGLDLGTGQRFLRLQTLPASETLDQLIPQVFAPLAEAVAECPPAWHFWGEAPRFFSAVPATDATAAPNSPRS